MATDALWDAVVVGLGGVGSFALRALAKEGKGGRFLGLERYTQGHGWGSSHGKTRIYRRAYFEHPNYVPWIDYSLDVFRELQSWSGKALLQQCGTLLIEPGIGLHGSSTAEMNMGRLPPLLRASWESAQQHGIPVEYLNHSDLVERFPQFHYKPEHHMVGLLEPGGGFARCELAQEAALAQALAESRSNNNISILERCYLKSFREVTDALGSTVVELQVVTDTIGGGVETELVSTRCLLVCAGGWAGQLLTSWAPYLRPTRQVQAWIDVTQQSQVDPRLFGCEQMPSFVMVTPDWPQPLYGVPCDSGDGDAAWRRRLKVGIHGRDIWIENPSQNAQNATRAEINEVQMATSRAIQASAWSSNEQLPTIVETKPCIYTMTPDTQYIIGIPDGYRQVFAVAGLSGHGFKNTPALGQMMADFALGKDLARWKFDFCSPSRFLKTPKY